MSGYPGKKTPRAILSAAVTIREYLRMGPATTRELARRASVSQATVRRALGWLRKLGAPIRSERGDRTSRWSCERGWELPSFRLARGGEFVPVLEASGQ